MSRANLWPYRQVKLHAGSGRPPAPSAFYEADGFLPQPQRASCGDRLYDASAIDRLTFLRVGQVLGLTSGELADVVQMLDRGEAPCRHVTELIDPRIGEIDVPIGDLRRLGEDVAGLAEIAAGVELLGCPPENVCRILTQTS